MIWGIGVVALLGLGAMLLSNPYGHTWDRAFGVLAGYGMLFWGTLLKIWWSAGKNAVEVDDETLSFLPLWAFRPTRIPLAAIHVAEPKVGTHSLRLVVEKKGVARELFLNLAVIARHHHFVEALGERLEASGLSPVPDKEDAWARPDWKEPLLV